MSGKHPLRHENLEKTYTYAIFSTKNVIHSLNIPTMVVVVELLQKYVYRMVLNWCYITFEDVAVILVD